MLANASVVPPEFHPACGNLFGGLIRISCLRLVGTAISSRSERRLTLRQGLTMALSWIHHLVNQHFSRIPASKHLAQLFSRINSVQAAGNMGMPHVSFVSQEQQALKSKASKMIVQIFTTKQTAT